MITILKYLSGAVSGAYLYIWLALLAACAAFGGYQWTRATHAVAVAAQAESKAASAQADVKVSESNYKQLGAAVNRQNEAITSAAVSAQKEADRAQKRAAAVLAKPLAVQTTSGPEAMNAWLDSKN